MIMVSRFHALCLTICCLSISLILHGTILLHRADRTDRFTEPMLPINAVSINVKILQPQEKNGAIKNNHHLKNKIASSQVDEELTKQKKSTAKLIGKLKLTYPKISRLLGEEGAVKLRIEVASNGRAVAARVINSSGYERLDHYAKKAAMKAHYLVEIGVKEEQKEMHFLTLEVAFQLNEEIIL